MQISIRGQLFDSVRQAADHFGVHRNTVNTALARGSIDSVGLRRPYGPRPQHFTFEERVFKSQREAARYLGLPQSTFQVRLQTFLGRKKLRELFVTIDRINNIAGD